MKLPGDQDSVREPTHVVRAPGASARPSHGATVALLDLIPGLDGGLTGSERSWLSRLRVPVLTAFAGPFDLEGALRDAQGFAIAILEGMVLRPVRLGEHSGLQLLGPGDIVGRPGGSGSGLIAQADPQVGAPVRYAVLDDRVAALARRCPRVVEGLQVSSTDQQQRVLAQVLICQLPRVEDRVLALMWLLAETWGSVTPSGTVVPVRLTHEAIGRLVGARRSTVTLALKALESRGVLLRGVGEWLILERP